jgi:hypothetical protein
LSARFPLIAAIALAGCSFDSSGGTLGIDATGPTIDGATGPDGSAQTCGLQADTATVALYHFEESALLEDATGTHTGTATGAPLSTPGPNGCGSAVMFPAGQNVHVELADHPDWDIADGSIDLWVKSPAPGAVLGVLSRDASGYGAEGHVSLLVAVDGFIAVRLQNGGADTIRCSTQLLPAGQWARVVFNFGQAGTELYVDGVLGTRTDMFTAFNVAYTCGVGDTRLGLAGNDNPWVVGVLQVASTEGQADALRDYFDDGAIDQLRISSTRR